MRRRYVAYYCAFLQQWQDTLAAVGQPEAMAAIDAEWQNVRHAWREAIALHKWPALAGCLESLYQYCLVQGRLSDGIELMSAALTAWQGPHATGVVLPFAELRFLVARLLVREAGLRRQLQQLDEAVALWQACLPLLYATPGDAAGEIAQAFCGLAGVAMQRKQAGPARQLLEAALGLYRQCNLSSRLATVLNCLGALAAATGDYEEADRYFRECLAIRQDSGDRLATAICLNDLSQIAEEQQEYSRSLALRRQ